MKKFFRSKFGKQLLVGLPMIVLAVILGLVLQPLHEHSLDSLEWFIWCIAVLGTGLAGFFTCLCGINGCCAGYVFVLARAATNLPEPWNLCVALPTLGLLLMQYFVYIRKKKKRKVDEGSQEEPEPLPITAQNFGKLSVIAQRTVEGSYYQLIYQSGKLLCYRVGSELRGPDPEKIINDLSQPLPPLGQKDFSFPVSEVTNCKLSTSNQRYCLTLHFKFDGKRRSFGVLTPGEAEARKFFSIIFPALR